MGRFLPYITTCFASIAVMKREIKLVSIIGNMLKFICLVRLHLAIVAGGRRRNHSVFSMVLFPQQKVQPLLFHTGNKYSSSHSKHSISRLM